MANCQNCNKKKPWGEKWIKGKEIQDGAVQMGIQDRKHIGTLESEKDICMDCIMKIWSNHPVEFTEYFNENATDAGREDARNSEAHQKIFRAAEALNQKSNKKIKSKPNVSALPSTSMSSNTSSGALPSGNLAQSSAPSAGYTTAEQLKQIADGQHDSFKKQWNKGALVEFKSERVVILHRMTGAIVQFLVAYDQVTKEGYRLMAIDEGKTVDGGAGFSGGLNAYFYFQKMDNVR